MEAGWATQTIELASRGGVVVWALGGFSLAGAAIVLVKLYQFGRLRIWSRRWLTEALDAVAEGDSAQAYLVGRVVDQPRCSEP